MLSERAALLCFYFSLSSFFLFFRETLSTRFHASTVPLISHEEAPTRPPSQATSHPFHLLSDLLTPLPPDWESLEDEFVWVTPIYLSHAGTYSHVSRQNVTKLNILIQKVCKNARFEGVVTSLYILEWRNTFGVE